MKTLLKTGQDCFEIPLLPIVKSEHVVSELQRNGILGCLNYLCPDKTRFFEGNRIFDRYVQAKHAKKES